VPYCLGGQEMKGKVRFCLRVTSHQVARGNSWLGLFMRDITSGVIRGGLLLVTSVGFPLHEFYCVCVYNRV
jgi:hypothetical protein